jgi:hypothetical protein
MEEIPKHVAAGPYGVVTWSFVILICIVRSKLG